MVAEKKSRIVVMDCGRWWVYENIDFLQDSFKQEEVLPIYNCIQPILNRVPKEGGITLVRIKGEAFYVYIGNCPGDNLSSRYYVELPKAYLADRAIRTGQLYEFEGLYTIIKSS